MSKVRNLETLLHSLCENTTGETVTVRDLLDAVGRRAYGPIFLMLGFIAISPLTVIPGGTWIVALVTLLIAVQVVIGRSYPWLPRRALDFTFKREYLVQGVEASQKYAHMVDRWLRPRLTFLTEPPFVQLIGLVCIAAALVTFPLGFFPFAPILPGLTVLLLGLGLAARDGFVLLLAGAALAGAFIVLVRVIPRLINGLNGTLI